MAQRFRDVADFCFVYLAEAHAADVWPLGAQVVINEHKSLDDRIAAAARIAAADGWNVTDVPVFVDTMSDSFDKHFFAWPERFYVVAGPRGRLAHVAMPSLSDRGFDRSEIESCLSRFAATAALAISAI